MQTAQHNEFKHPLSVFCLAAVQMADYLANLKTKRQPTISRDRERRLVAPSWGDLIRYVLYVYINIYIYTYICIHIHLHTFLYVHIYIYMCIISNNIMLHFIHFMILQCTRIYYATLYCITSYCSTLHCVLHCVALHYTTLHYISLHAIITNDIISLYSIRILYYIVC